MSSRRGPQTKSIPMKIGNDPKLWRFESLQNALEANTHLIGALIRVGQEVAETGQNDDESSQTIPILAEV
ncbi:MAG: hypothetical protein H0X30_18160 [Anaerolineae bacterium]|nr:hypothetical protein [Anaerolineae bacterium]